ncbi:gypsy type transposase [Tanacetum coccineum]
MARLGCGYFDDNTLRCYEVDDNHFNVHSCHLIGSSNGLICISPFYKVIVSNPMTREVKYLRNPEIPYIISLCWGFGYDSSTGDYKVILGFRRGDNLTCFQVLSLKSDVWKVVGDVKYTCISRVGTLCNGALHWFMYDRNEKKVIPSFNLSKEKFKEIPQPDWMDRDTIQLEAAVSTISQEYLLEFTSEYGISEDLHPELPAPGDRIVDSPEDKIGRVFPIVVDWRESAPKDEKLVEGSYSVEEVARLDTRRTPIQKQPEALLCLVGLSRRYYLGDDVYPTFLYDDGREMDLFNLISAPNPTKIKTGTRSRAAHEVPLLTVTANRVIDMEESSAATESSETPSTIERSPLEFANENPSQQINKGDGTEDQVLETGASEVPPTGHVSTTEVAPNIVMEEEDAADVPLVSKRRRKRVNDGANANAPPKVLRKYFDVSRPAQSTFKGKSLASTGLEAGYTLSAPASQEIPAGTIDLDPLSFAEPQAAPA